MLSPRPLSGTAGVAVEFTPHRVRAVVADLESGQILEEGVQLGYAGEVPRAAHMAASLVERLIGDAGLSSSDVVGAVAGLSALSYRVVVELSRHLGIPVRAERACDLAALGERAAGAARGHDDIILIRASSSIDAAIVLGGRLCRGAQGRAGGIGHVSVRPQGDLCGCGRRGCLDTVVSTRALAAALRPVYGDSLGPADVLALARRGDPPAVRAVTDAGAAVGRVVGDLCTLLNPSVVVVGGEMGALAPFASGMLNAVPGRATPAIAASVRIVPAGLGSRAVLLGALAELTDARDGPKSSEDCAEIGLTGSAYRS